MSYGSLAHDDQIAPPPARGHLRATATADAGLAATLARCGAAGDFASDEALATVAGFARGVIARGYTPVQVATMVRRSLAAAAPAAMTVATFETIAHCLVRHAMVTLIHD
jgi:hypothetical protein